MCKAVVKSQIKLVSNQMKNYVDKRKITNTSWEILGEPSGDVSILKEVLRHGISSTDYYGNVYLSLVEYNASQVKLGLFLETKNENTIKAIAYYCYESIGEIDIFNLNEMDQGLIAKLKKRVKPFI